MRSGAQKQIEGRAHKENRKFKEGVQQRCGDKIAAQRKSETSRE